MHFVEDEDRSGCGMSSAMLSLAWSSDSVWGLRGRSIVSVSPVSQSRSPQPLRKKAVTRRHRRPGGPEVGQDHVKYTLSLELKLPLQRRSPLFLGES